MDVSFNAPTHFNLSGFFLFHSHQVLENQQLLGSVYILYTLDEILFSHAPK
jgi:hypothetical protein